MIKKLVGWKKFSYEFKIDEQKKSYPSWLLWKTSIFDERCDKICLAFCLFASSIAVGWPRAFRMAFN